jgi:hypothetical protein
LKNAHASVALTRAQRGFHPQPEAVERRTYGARRETQIPSTKSSPAAPISDEVLRYRAFANGSAQTKTDANLASVMTAGERPTRAYTDVADSGRR